MIRSGHLWRAARRGLWPGRPLQDPARLFRVAVALVTAVIVGHFLHDMNSQNLLCVGAFMGAIGSLIPHHRSRIVAASVTGAAEVVGVLVGVLLHGQWWAVLLLIFVGFFAGGIVRVVGVGLSIRVLVVIIMMAAFAEISPSVRVGMRETLLFAAGVAITVACQLLPPFEPRHAAQRGAVAGLFDGLARGSASGAALMAADRVLAVRYGADGEVGRLVRLTEEGEQIARLLHAVDNRPDSGSDSDARRAEVSRRLSDIATAIRRRTRPRVSRVQRPRDPADRLWAELNRAIGRAEQLARGETSVAVAPADRRAPTPLELVRDELRPGAPMFRHAIRLAIAGTVGEIVGLLIGAHARTDLLPAHGFWVCLTVVLILFPDWGEATARGISRTAGTLVGAVCGVALSFLPADPVVHTVVMIVLFLGYLTFRSCGQPWTMLWVVMWISSLSPGPWGAVTRAFDTIVGAALALIVFHLLPTWQRERLSGLLVEWLHAQAEQLRSLCDLWGDPAHAAGAAARATVRSRLARLEFLQAGTEAHHEPISGDHSWPDDAIGDASTAMYGVAKQVAVLAVVASDANGGATVAVRHDAAALAMRVEQLAAVAGHPVRGDVSLPDLVVNDAEPTWETTDPDVRSALDNAWVALGELAAAVP